MIRNSPNRAKIPISLAIQSLPTQIPVNSGDLRVKRKPFSSSNPVNLVQSIANFVYQCREFASLCLTHLIRDSVPGVSIPANFWRVIHQFLCVSESVNFISLTNFIYHSTMNLIFAATFLFIVIPDNFWAQHVTFNPNRGVLGQFGLKYLLLKVCGPIIVNM